MSEACQLVHPWLVAAWPGMGNVALNAGVYLLSKLDMQLMAVLETGNLFDIEHVEVKAGIIQPIRPPRNRFFVWIDPEKKHDLVVFLGEAQPNIGRNLLCVELVKHAKKLGVERVFTFAAMATAMHPAHESRVFGAATNEENLAELKGLEVEPLEEGHIGGLNGVLLGAAAEHGLQGACLLGEMPHIFHQLPYPKASLAILRKFAPLMKIDLDLAEIEEQARAMDERLGELLEQLEAAYGERTEREEEEFPAPPAEEPRLSREEEQRLEALFAAAAKDRSRGFELKQELDRLGLFKEYEDRFLDLFKKPQ